MKKKQSGYKDEDDRGLLVGISKGDKASFAELYDRYSSAAFGLAWKICGNRTIAEDVVQEAFLSIWRRPSSYDASRGSISSYLFGAVHHKAVDAIRHEAALKRREETSFDPPMQDKGEEVVEAAWISVRRDVVRRALDRLSPVQREALELAYLEGFTYSEVAEKLGIPLGTAKTRLRDGMIRLRGLISSSEIGGTG